MTFDNVKIWLPKFQPFDALTSYLQNLYSMRSTCGINHEASNLSLLLQRRLHVYSHQRLVQGDMNVLHVPPISIRRENSYKGWRQTRRREGRGDDNGVRRFLCVAVLATGYTRTPIINYVWPLYEKHLLSLT